MQARRVRGLTVDSNGHGLSQDIAVGALEGRDLAQLVELLVVIADALGRFGVHDLEVDVVGLCDSEDGGGARVALKKLQSVSAGGKFDARWWLVAGSGI